ncbi:hypothetical protein HK097_002824, partial [Rhizophlyctis rosea]
MLRSLILAYALFLADHRVTTSATEDELETTQPLAGEEAFQWMRRYGAVEVWVDGRPSTSGPSNVQKHAPTPAPAQGSSLKDKSSLSRYDS